MNHRHPRHHSNHSRNESQDVDESSNLLSYVEDLTKGCKAFRILVCGRSGVGKSTLVSEVFDFEADNADTATPGEHDINKEITSGRNASLVLHDSRGLEAGSSDNLESIRKFIQDRRKGSLAEQVHAIWYCIQIPTAGERLFQAGDEELFRELKKCNKAPLIVVFTKFDRLVKSMQLSLREDYMAQGLDRASAVEKSKLEAREKAVVEYKRTCVSVLNSGVVASAWSNFCFVSFKDRETIIDLVKMTKATLSGQKFRHLEMLWATAQKADIDIKLEASIMAGKNMYWTGLVSTFLPLQGLKRVSTLTVLRWIHRDIVRIWNFNDPQKILIGANFRRYHRSLFTERAAHPGVQRQGTDDERLLNGAAEAAWDPSNSDNPLTGSLATSMEQSAFSTPATARILMAYVADLTLGLQSLYLLVKPRDNKVIDKDDVVKAYSTYYKSETRKKVHDAITDWIGDEEVLKAWKREKASDRVKALVEENRFNLQDLFQAGSEPNML
ncbi:hypothetical protein SISNIDRAFT_483043 [Sistotremastrum niveocremeum HHB9708]|uniref:G domain-containing protein n=1 Tax=Sistotremastrum niveocremeum HHB9708 TaxID=1314777 RepID=A0A164Y1B5_9AGAM|nr:hypothetical protein SISNIDRAFT_483043 [Sistotremastrum niveocremeum HHB9708]